MELKKHVDTIVILTGVLASVLWMNSSSNNIKQEISTFRNDVHQEIGFLRNEMNTLKIDVQKDINSLRNDITIIKTVLIMKDIMPATLATNEEK